VRYLCLIYTDEKLEPNPETPEGKQHMNDYWAYTGMVKERGVYQAGEALHPVATATSVRVRNGERMVTDGPFAETKEQLGGFYLLDCKDIDEAIDMAAQIPSAKFGTIEVRPIVEFS
jgi:hypothetical protein